MRLGSPASPIREALDSTISFPRALLLVSAASPPARSQRRCGAPSCVCPRQGLGPGCAARSRSRPVRSARAGAGRAGPVASPSAGAAAAVPGHSWSESRPGRSGAASCCPGPGALPALPLLARPAAALREPSLPSGCSGDAQGEAASAVPARELRCFPRVEQPFPLPSGDRPFQPVRGCG